MEIFEITLIVATFLCALVAGFLFAFAVVVMPGIRTLGDSEFLRAFQVIDGVIQNNQPFWAIPGASASIVGNAAVTSWSSTTLPVGWKFR